MIRHTLKVLQHLQTSVSGHFKALRSRGLKKQHLHMDEVFSLILTMTGYRMLTTYYAKSTIQSDKKLILLTAYSIKKLNRALQYNQHNG